VAIERFYPSSYTTNLSKGTLSNPTNAYTNNSTYAELSSADRNDQNDIDYSGFDLSSIPSGSTINSVSIEAELRFGTTGETDTLYFGLLDNGVTQGTNLTISTEPTTDTVFENTNVGTWTLSSLQSASLNIDLYWKHANSKNSETIYIDYFAVVVDYTAPTYNFSGSVSITHGDVLSFSSKKGGEVGLSDSYGDQDNINSHKGFLINISDSIGDLVTASGTAALTIHISFTVSEGNIVFATGEKNARASPLISHGDNLGIIASKNTKNSVSLISGSQSNLSSYKNIKTSISDSLGDNVSISITKMLTIHTSLSVSEGDIVSLSGLKKNNGFLTVSNGDIISTTSSKGNSDSIDISHGYQSEINVHKNIDSETVSSLGDNIFISASSLLIYSTNISISHGDNIAITGVAKYFIKIMSIDNELNLSLKDEIIESNIVSLDENGVLTVTELIEGETFNLDSSGVLTVKTLTENNLNT